MVTAPIYYAVFYDVNKPKTSYFAMHKRISEKQWFNITDGIEGKSVQLRSVDDKIANYKIISQSIFSILNSVDNSFFVICDCQIIPKPSDIWQQ